MEHAPEALVQERCPGIFVAYPNFHLGPWFFLFNWFPTLVHRFLSLFRAQASCEPPGRGGLGTALACPEWSLTLCGTPVAGALLASWEGCMLITPGRSIL